MASGIWPPWPVYLPRLEGAWPTGQSRCRARLEAWLNIVDRYLAWIEILGEKTAEEIAMLDPNALPAFRQALHHAPSLQDLAEGNLAWIPFLQGIRKQSALERICRRILDRSRFQGPR